MAIYACGKQFHLLGSLLVPEIVIELLEKCVL